MIINANLITIKYIGIILGILIIVAFITHVERKLLRLVGLRVGPRKVSIGGILQPLFDAKKLINKQINFLSNFSYIYYYGRSLIIITIIIFLWIILPREPIISNLKFSILIIIVIIGLNSLNSIVLGWRTYRKYSLVGRVRTLAQLISYEGVLYLCLFFIIFLSSRFRIYTTRFDIEKNIAILFPAVFIIWIPAILAELNRTPYDFSEGERELVRGFNTEFGALGFTLIFLAEYGIILFFSLLTSLLFFFDEKLLIFVFIFFFTIWIRSVLPRFRFDKLIMLAWKFFIPFLTFFFIITIAYVY